MRELPATPTQSTLYGLLGLAGDPALQNLQVSISIGEMVTPERLRTTWQALAAAHPILRASFRRDPSGDVLRRDHDAAEAPWRTLDWKNVPPPDLAARWAQVLREDAAAPIDLTTPPLARFLVIELPGGQCHVLATFSKILLDEDSLARLVAEWLLLLDNGSVAMETPGDPPAVDLEAATAWWREAWPSGDPWTRPAPRGLEKSDPGRVVRTRPLDPDLVVRLNALAFSAQIPPQTPFLAATGLVLGRLVGVHHAVTLAALPGGPTDDLANHSMILPAVVPVGGEPSVTAWLERVGLFQTEARQNLLGAEAICRAVGKSLRDATVAVVFPGSDLNDRIHSTMPRWINSDCVVHQTALSPVTFAFILQDRPVLRCEFNPAVLPPAELDRILDRIVATLDRISTRTDAPLRDVAITTEADESAIARTRSPKTLVPSGWTIEAEIRRRAAGYLDRIAVMDPHGAELTYQEVVDHALALAGYLRASGLGNGWRLGVCLTPSSWVPIALLGVLEAGSTVVPLPSDAPLDWLVAKIESNDIELVLCDSHTATILEGSSKRVVAIDRSWEEISAAVPGDPGPSPERAAVWVGTPAHRPPVESMVTPEALAAACAATRDLVDVDDSSRVSANTEPGEPGFVELALATLLGGGCLIYPGRWGEVPDGITHVLVTAARWRAGLPEPAPQVALVETDGAPLDPRESTRMVTFWSPCGLAGIALVAHGAGGFAGVPSSGIMVALDDPAGNPLPPLYESALLAASGAEPVKPTGMRAWRSATGEIVLAPPPPPVSQKTPAANPAPAPPLPPQDAPPPPVPTGPWEPIVTLHEVADAPRLICIHDLDGSAERYRAFAKQFEGEWTIVATQARGLADGASAHTSIPSEAAALIEAITEADPDGPYCLFGFGFGAILAFEIASQLRTAGRGVDFLAFAGARPPEVENAKAWMKSLSQRVAGVFSKSPESPAGPLTPAAAHLRALRAYKTAPLDGPACVILGADLGRDVENAWLDCLPDGFIERVACGSDELLIEPSVRRLCAILRDLADSTPNNDS